MFLNYLGMKRKSRSRSGLDVSIADYSRVLACWLATGPKRTVEHKIGKFAADLRQVVSSFLILFS